MQRPVQAPPVHGSQHKESYQAQEDEEDATFTLAQQQLEMFMVAEEDGAQSEVEQWVPSVLEQCEGASSVLDQCSTTPRECTTTTPRAFLNFTPLDEGSPIHGSMQVDAYGCDASDAMEVDTEPDGPGPLSAAQKGSGAEHSASVMQEDYNDLRLMKEPRDNRHVVMMQEPVVDGVLEFDFTGIDSWHCEPFKASL